MLLDKTQNDNRNDKLTPLKFRLLLAKLSSVDIDNFPKSIGATITANPLLPGHVWKFFDTKISTLKPDTKAGESPITGKLSIPFLAEGLNKALLSWIYENLGDYFIAVWERCSDGQLFLGGSPCSGGLQLKLVSIGEIDGKVMGASLTLDGADCPEPFWFYDGVIERETPTVVSLAAGTTFAIATGSQYTLTDNAAAKTLTDITAVTDGDVGRIIELVGAGVNHPTLIETSAVFILNAGLSFSAKVGSTISFQITKTATGYAFYEVYRS
jgi:hypothetical protein